LEFKVRDHVYLRVSPCYIGPFPILERCETVAYKLDPPPSLAGVHDIFHVLQLKKYLNAPMDIMLPKVTPLEADLLYPDHQSKSWIRRIISQGVKPSSSSKSN
jgi:hypothetical protein